MGLKQLEDVTYFRLNNEINRPINGQIMLHKDKEALEAFFKENVVPNTMVFNSITDKINFLIEHNYIETAFIKKYRPEFLEELHQFIKDQNFQFKSFMAAYKFYNQYALKTWKTASSLTPFISQMVMKRLLSILLTKSSTNVINLLLLLS